jgi:hypothetical protein
VELISNGSESWQDSLDHYVMSSGPWHDSPSLTKTVI